MHLVATFARLVESITETLTAPSRRNFLTVVSGWLFAPRRTITSCLVAAGAVGTKHHSAYHRLFSSARWVLDQVGLSLYRRIRPWCVPERKLLTLDDTRSNKRGKKMFGVGMHYDPLLSTRSRKVVTWGHSWVVLAVLVRLPFSPQRYFSLPILFRLYLNKNAAKKWRRTYRTRPELGVELLRVLAKAYPQDRFHMLTDESYGGQSVLNHLPKNVGMTSRLTLKARLYTAPPERKPGQVGRPRRRGTRLPTPQQMVADKKAGKEFTLSLYGRKDRVRMVETVAYAHNAPDRPLKIVAQRPLRGGRPVQAFFSTDTETGSLPMLSEFEGRWSIEECFFGSKTYLGFEQPQGWTRQAVLRTSPVAMLLYSLILLWFAEEGKEQYKPLVRPWYRRKRWPSFADALTTLRRVCLEETLSQGVVDKQGLQNLLEPLLFAA